jgi:ribosomal-protein-alanine N-acetyltransferase
MNLSKSMKPICETERLLIREVQPLDVEGFFEMDSDPEVHRFLGNRPIESGMQAANIIEHIMDQYKNNGYGRWAVILKETLEFIGWAGFKLEPNTVNGHANYCDFGYRFKRKHWGRGFATESALATLDYGLKEMKFSEVFAAAHVDNTASNKILKRLGFAFSEAFEYDGSTHNWYELKATDWMKRAKPKILDG